MPGLRAVGPVGFAKELFAPKGESTGLLRVLLVVVFFAAGCLEVVSILFRPVSLSFRLYGNVFAGENMLETMAAIPRIGWLVQVLFYFLELLVGLVQGALVFMLLTAVFTLLICRTSRRRKSQDSRRRRKDLTDGRQYSRWFGGTGRGHRRRRHRHEGVGGRRSRTPGHRQSDGPVDSGHCVRRSHRLLYTLFLVK